MGGGGIAYVSSVCVTFPWMMCMGEVEEMEDMRGAKYTWTGNTTTTTNDNTQTEVLKTDNVLNVDNDDESDHKDALARRTLNINETDFNKEGTDMIAKI